MPQKDDSAIIKFMNNGQADILQEIFVDLAKGLFLSAFAAPIINIHFTSILVFKAFSAGAIFTMLALEISRHKESL